MKQDFFERAAGTNAIRTSARDPVLDDIKIAACLFMFIDHLYKIEAGLWTDCYPLALGRIAWPLFVYVFATLFSAKPSAFGNTVRRAAVLLLFGVGTQPVFEAYFNTWRMNIMFTFALSVIFVYSFELLSLAFRGEKGPLAAALGMSGIAFSILVSFFVEYGVVGVVTTGGATVMFRKFKDSRKGVLAIFLGTWLANGFSPFVFAALPFVWFHLKFGDGKDMLAYGYTETRGRSLHTLWRYGFHLFYFGHIYALYVVKKLVFEVP